MKIGFTKTRVSLLLVLGVLVTGSFMVMGIDKGGKASENPSEKTSFWLTHYHLKGFHSKNGYPNAGSIDCLRHLCNRAFFGKSEGKSFLSETKKKYYNFTGDLSARPRILKDRLNLAKWRQPDTAGLKLKLVFEIDNAFKQITAIVKIGYDVYFTLSKYVRRINKEGWHDYVTLTRSDIIADLGRNRVVGYCPGKPLTLYGFDWSFANEVRVDLPDYRLRQELHKLDDRRFLFHNLRMHHSEYAVEIYDVTGRRLMETFNYTAYHYPSPHFFNLETRTLLTTDKHGHFYIAFQYPLNPYRVWKFDKDGNKIDIFGFYMDDPERYEFPDEIITAKFSDIEYYGIRQLWVINKLLTDHLGYVYVFISKNRIPPGKYTPILNFKQDKKKTAVPAKHYLDIYSPKGEFIGRLPFDYGFPEVIDKGIIYCRKKINLGGLKIARWKLTAVALEGLHKKR